MSYLYTKALLRIWFSNDPESWMHQKNQLRLIIALQDNPDTTITLLTRASILSPDAQQAMWKFKEKHKNLVIVDLDELLPTLTNPIDRKLAAFALQELDAKQPAAARDLLTLIPKVLMLGNYTDFEIKFNFGLKNSHVASI